jgi:hypothetical protein
LEGGVVGGEDGQVGSVGNGIGEAGCVDGSEEGAETGFLSDGADVRWEGEETVDDVDDSTIEGDVLVVLLVGIRIGLNDWSQLTASVTETLFFNPEITTTSPSLTRHSTT